MAFVLTLLLTISSARIVSGLAASNEVHGREAWRSTDASASGGASGLLGPQSTDGPEVPSASCTLQEVTRRRVLWNSAATATAVTSGGLLLSPLSATAGGADERLLPAVPTVKLGSLEVTRTIMGQWQLAGGHGRYRESDAIDTMKAHYDKGITTLDTADIYGPSEEIIGKFIKKEESMSSNDGKHPIPCTKFCCFRYLEDIDRAEVRLRIQKACERLQVPKLPLVAFFWGNYDVKRYVDVALWLTELKEDGLIQEIGATNFDLKRLKELKDADVPIVSHQVQLSALDRRPIQSGMADWCVENNVSLIGFGTVASGILSNEYLGKGAPTQEEKNTASMRMYSNTATRFGPWSLVQELLKTMNAVAGEVRSSGRCPQCNISNVAQRYVLDTPGVASIIIGVRNQDHLRENVRTHSFTLTTAEKEAIDAVVAKRQGPKGDVWDIERSMM